MDPIITFALPRSGSTFLMRLLNKCYDYDNQSINYNGEFDILHNWVAIADALKDQDEYGVKSVQQLIEDKEFLSHYHHANTQETRKFLGNLYREYCGGQNRNWGWKNVNYGCKGRKLFLHQINTLVDIYPNCKFIFLDRSHTDVVTSMIKVGYWGDEHKQLLGRVMIQTENYQAAINKHRERSHVLSYEQLIDVNKFQSFVRKFDFTITQGDYLTLSNNVRKNDEGTLTEAIVKEKQRTKALK